MKRTKNIQGAFKSVVPEGTAGDWSVGYSGHTDNSDFFSYDEFAVTEIRNIGDPGIGDVYNDVFVDYTYLSGTTMTGTTSIYSYV